MHSTMRTSRSFTLLGLVIFGLAACSSPPYAEKPDPPLDLYQSSTEELGRRAWTELIEISCSSTADEGDAEDCVDEGQDALREKAPAAALIHRMCDELDSGLPRGACYRQSLLGSRSDPLINFHQRCDAAQKGAQAYEECIAEGFARF